MTTTMLQLMRPVGNDKNRGFLIKFGQLLPPIICLPSSSFEYKCTMLVYHFIGTNGDCNSFLRIPITICYQLSKIPLELSNAQVINMCT